MTPRLFLLACLALLTAPAFAGTTGYDLGQVMVKYHDAATDFGAALTDSAKYLCYKLFALDLAWALIGRMLKGPDLVEMGTILVMRVMWLGFVVWVMNNPDVPLAIVNSFIQLGKNGSHTSAIGPGDVLGQGIDLVQLLMTKFGDNAKIAGISVPAGVAAVANPFAAFLIGGSLIVILVCFSMLAAQFAVAWIQLWFYIAVYPIALAFGVMKWTKDIAMKVITTPLVYGVRFLAVYFVIAVATKVAGDFGKDIANLSLTNLTPIWTVLGGSILILILAMKVPTLASDLLSGTASMSAADGVGAVMAGGGAIAALGAGLYAGGGAAYKGLSSMLSGAGGSSGSLAGAAAMGASSGQAAGAAGGAAAGGAPGFGSTASAGTMPGASGGGASGSGAAAASASSSGSGTVPAPPAPSASSASSGTVPAPPAPSASSASSGTVPAPPAPSASSGTMPALPAPSASSGTMPALPAPSARSASSGTVPAPPAPSARSGTMPAPAASADNTASLSDAAGSPEASKANDGQSSEKLEPKGPTAADQSAKAAHRVLDEMGKTSGGGSGIQTHHGDD